MQWGIDTEDLSWPDIPPGAEELKRAIVVLDEAGNELARSEGRTVVGLGEGGNGLPRSSKRGIEVLDEASNDLSLRKGGVAELDEGRNGFSNSES